MRTVRVRNRKGNLQLYVKPESAAEKVALWFRGYRVWHFGVGAGVFMVKKGDNPDD